MFGKKTPNNNKHTYDRQNHLRLRVRDDDSQGLHAEREARQPLDQLGRKELDSLRFVRVSRRSGVGLVPLVELVVVAVQGESRWGINVTIAIPVCYCSIDYAPTSRIGGHCCFLYFYFVQNEAPPILGVLLSLIFPRVAGSGSKMGVC